MAPDICLLHPFCSDLCCETPECAVGGFVFLLVRLLLLAYILPRVSGVAALLPRGSMSGIRMSPLDGSRSEEPVGWRRGGLVLLALQGYVYYVFKNSPGPRPQ